MIGIANPSQKIYIHDNVGEYSPHEAAFTFIMRRATGNAPGVSESINTLLSKASNVKQKRKHLLYQMTDASSLSRIVLC